MPASDIPAPRGIDPLGIETRDVGLRANSPRVNPSGDPRARPISAGTGGAPRSAGGAQGRTRGYLLAILAHTLLAAFLIIGVQWQTSQPVAIQAELWEPPPPTRTTPQPQVQPKPLPEPAPVKPVDVKPPDPPPAPDPEIALEKARKEKELRDKQAADAAAAERRRQEDQQRKELEQREQERKQADAKRQADAQAAKEAAAKEAAAKDAAAAKAAQQEADARKAAEAKKAADAKRVADEKARQDARQRNDYLASLQAMAGGDTPKSAKPHAGAAVGGDAGGLSGRSEGAYGDKVASAVRSNTIFAIPADMSGNPKAQFKVSLLPDCSVASVQLVKSSGYPNWDQAAQRAIQRTDPFPRPTKGTCDREFMLYNGPRDAQ